MSRQVGRRSVLARRFANTLVTGAAADGLVTHVALSIDDGVRFGLADAPQATDRFGSLVGMTAAWLDVIEVRLLTGRRLTDADDPTAAMLSARAAEMIAPEASPLGMVLRVAHGSGAAREVRVVGVVADNLLRPTVARPDPVIYVPLPKQLSGEFTLRGACRRSRSAGATCDSRTRRGRWPARSTSSARPAPWPWPCPRPDSMPCCPTSSRSVGARSACAWRSALRPLVSSLW